MNVVKRLSQDKTKIFYSLEWGREPGQRASTGIFTYVNPKNQIQKNFNKEALALLETKRSETVLDMQAAGTGHIVQHKLKKNFLDYYEQFVKKNRRDNNRSLPCSFSAFKNFLRIEKDLKDGEILYISPVDITENLCERFRQYLLDRLTGETPGDYFMRFKRVMRAATKERYFRENPTAEVKVKVHPTGIRDVLNVEEYRVLLNSHCSNYEVKKAAVCSMYTGFRWCDIEILEWWQIKNESIVLRKQSKTGVPLEIPLHPVVKAILGERRSPNDLVFSLPTADGSNGVLKKWVIDAGIDKHITWHCLRHSVSDLLQDAGIDVETVAAFLGQKSAKYVLQTYRKRVKAKDIKEAAKRLPSPAA